MKHLLIVMFVTSMYAQTYNIKYSGEFSIFGEVAHADLTYTKEKNKYHITIKGVGSGIVAALTQKKVYIYESIGMVKEGVLIPKKYMARELSEDRVKIKTYTFDYEHNKTHIYEYTKELVEDESSIFDVFDEEYEATYKEKITIDEDVIDDIFYDDMVSVFFNKRNHLLSMKEGEVKVIRAVGSRDTQEGVSIEFIEKKSAKYIYKIKITKDYLSEGTQNANFVLDENNILYETSMDGIIFFGDARVKRSE